MKRSNCSGRENIYNLANQFLLFSIAGGICFCIDYGMMIFLTEVVGFLYLVSCAISFLLSNILNYIISTHLVFQSKQKMHKTEEFLVFAIMGLIGLGLMELLMFVSVEKIGINYMASKLIATALVMIYNFISRKLFFEKIVL